MRLEHVLLAMAPKQHKQLADILGISGLSKRRDEATMALFERLNTSEGFRRVWLHLSEEERHIYLLSIVEMHNDGYVVGISRARLLAALHTSYGIAMEQSGPIISRLHELGLFGYTQIWYIGDGYEVPVELAPWVEQECAQALCAGVAIDADEVRVVLAYGQMLTRDVVRLAARVAAKPLPLTKQGTIYKREIGRLLPLLRARDSAGMAMTGQLADTPFALHLCMRILENAHALLMREGTASMQAAHTTNLLRASQEQWDELIAQAALQTLNFGHAHVFRIVRSMMEALPPGQWYGIEDEMGKVLGNADEERGWRLAVRHYLRVMALCGVVDVGVHAVHGEVARIRERIKDAPSVSAWVVQPNLEVLVPEMASPVLHFLAGQIGELQRADEMSSYRLTKQSVLQLCDRGWTAADIEQALQTFSQAPLAQSVVRTLRDWVAEYDKAVLWDVLLVRFTSASLLDAFAADPRGRKAMVDRVGDAAAIVRRSAEKTVREVLSDIGAPAPQGIRTAVDEPQSGDSKGRRGDTKANQIALRKLLSPDLVDLARQSVLSAGSREHVSVS